MSDIHQVPHICELLLLLWSLLLTLLLFEWLWGHRSEVLAMTPGGVCAELHFGGFINVYPLIAPLHTFSPPGNPVWESEGKREKSLFLGMILPPSLRGRSHFPLSFCAPFPSSGALCFRFASALVALSWQPFLRLRLHLSWPIAGNALIPALPPPWLWGPF